MTPAISFEVYQGTLKTGRLKYKCPDQDMALQFIRRLRQTAEQNPFGWRGDITLVRIADGKRSRLKTFRRPRGDVKQLILRLLETVNAVPMLSPPIQRSDDVRPVRSHVGHERSRAA